MVNAVFAGLGMLKLIAAAIAGVILCVYGAKARSVATVIVGVAPFFLLAAGLTGQDEFYWCTMVLFVGACVLKVLENRRKRAEKQAADPCSPRVRH